MCEGKGRGHEAPEGRGRAGADRGALGLLLHGGRGPGEEVVDLGGEGAADEDDDECGDTDEGRERVLGQAGAGFPEGDWGRQGEHHGEVRPGAGDGGGRERGGEAPCRRRRGSHSSRTQRRRGQPGERDHREGDQVDRGAGPGGEVGVGAANQGEDQLGACRGWWRTCPCC